MSILVVGVSHRTAPVAVLERLALDESGVDKLVADVADSEHVREVAVVATCNRLEVYADVDRFHGSVEALSLALAERASEPRDDVTPYLYVHYDEGAVAHLFAVAAGLDSMVVGESQIVGQVREALRRGQDGGVVGTALNALLQQALRVGKRARAETDIGRAGQSVVSVALEQVPGGMAGKRVLVVGAGSMAALAVSSVVRRGAGPVVVANRTPDRARRLAEPAGGRAADLKALPEEITAADVVLSCTGATGLVITADVVRPRPLDTPSGERRRPLHVLDIALPHDVDPAVAAVPGVQLVGLADLAHRLEQSSAAFDVEGVRRIVAEEVAAFAAARRAASVTPTLVALRSLATEVVDAETQRLLSRLPDLDPVARAEVAQTVRRVADKLLHGPTVRIKELASHSGAISYTDALAELFALHPDAVSAVIRPDVEGSNGAAS